jgi:hypothetical protein
VGDEVKPTLLQLASVMPIVKLLAVNELVQQTTLAWMNEEDPEFDSRLDKIVTEAVDSFIAKADKRE